MKKTVYDNLCERLAVVIGNGSTKSSVNNYFRGFYRLMLEQLKINGVFKIPKFGVFTLHQSKEREMVSSDSNDEKQYIYVPSKYYVTFTPSKYLERSLNSGFKIVDKAEDLANKKVRKSRSASVTEVTANLFQTAIENKRRIEKAEEERRNG